MRGESNRVNPRCDLPMFRVCMGEWEGGRGVAFSAPSYTTRDKNFCFCIHQWRRASDWEMRKTLGGKIVAVPRG